jgi:hypothetical protein
MSEHTSTTGLCDAELRFYTEMREVMASQHVILLQMNLVLYFGSLECNQHSAPRTFVSHVSHALLLDRESLSRGTPVLQDAAVPSQFLSSMSFTATVPRSLE